MPSVNSVPSPGQICDLFRFVICSIVDNEDAVSVVPHDDGTRVTLLADCAEEDLGKVIGKQGRTARSLRTLLVAVSQRSGAYSLDIASGPR